MNELGSFNAKLDLTQCNIYDSINGAARELDIQPQTILNRCKNEKFNNYNFVEDDSSSK